MEIINLDQLKQGQKGITPIVAAFLVEATVICLMRHGHQSGVQLKLEGDYKKTFELHWSGEMTEQMRKSWNDQKEVTEYGATAIAALLLQRLTNYEILGRAEQEEGIDYYIGNDNSEAIQGFLEVSGIWKRTPDNTVNIRVNKKLKRIKKLKEKLPVFIIVTEFGQPKSKMVKNG